MHQEFIARLKDIKSKLNRGEKFLSITKNFNLQVAQARITANLEEFPLDFIDNKKEFIQKVFNKVGEVQLFPINDTTFLFIEG